MSKEEAIQAMKEGKKVTHRFFSSDEWMRGIPTWFVLPDDMMFSEKFSGGIQLMRSET